MEEEKQKFSDVVEGLDEQQVVDIISTFESNPSYDKLLSLLRHPFNET